MSFRFLYRKIPVDRRTCSYYRCQKPILRNIARDKSGHLYHWGCLQSARDEQYRCPNCQMAFDATEGSFETVQVQRGDDLAERLVMICPGCGYRALKSLSPDRFSREADIIV